MMIVIVLARNYDAQDISGFFQGFNKLRGTRVFFLQILRVNAAVKRHAVALTIAQTPENFDVWKAALGKLHFEIFGQNRRIVTIESFRIFAFFLNRNVLCLTF